MGHIHTCTYLHIHTYAQIHIHICTYTKSNSTIKRGTTKQFRMQRNHSKTLEEWMQEAKQDLIHVEIKDQHKLKHPCCIIQKQSSPKNGKTYYNLIMSNFSAQDMKLSNKLT